MIIGLCDLAQLTYPLPDSVSLSIHLSTITAPTLGTLRSPCVIIKLGV